MLTAAREGLPEEHHDALLPRAGDERVEQRAGPTAVAGGARAFERYIAVAAVAHEVGD